MSKFKFEKQFRAENPQTIGETDKQYDLDNYKEWLESKVDFLVCEFDKIANAPLPYNNHENNVFIAESRRIANNAVSFYNAT